MHLPDTHWRPGGDLLIGYSRGGQGNKVRCQTNNNNNNSDDDGDDDNSYKIMMKIMMPMIITIKCTLPK